MQRLYQILFSIFIIGSFLIFSPNELYATKTFFLPKIGCQFLVPDGYEKSDTKTIDLIESIRMSLYPESFSETEKRRRAKLEAVFHTILNEDLLPVRPFFTLQVRDSGRNINRKDIEIQINMLKKIKTNPAEVFQDTGIDNLLKFLITNELIIDRKNNSIIVMYHSKIKGDDQDECVIQFLNFYKTGLIIFNFYSDKNELDKNIKAFYTVINSFKLSKDFMANVEP